MIRIWFLVLALLSAAVSPSLAQTYPQHSGYVNDYVGVLPQEVGADLNAELVAFEERTTIEVVVAIVPSLSGQTEEQYAIGLGETWGVGQAGVDNGIVFLFAPNDRKWYIRVARGAKQHLTDAEVTRIGEAIVPHFRAGNLVDGVATGVHSIIDLANPAATIAPQVADAQTPSVAIDATPFFLIFGGLTGGLILLFLFASWQDSHKAKKDLKQRIRYAKESLLGNRRAAQAELRSAFDTVAQKDVQPSRKETLESIQQQLRPFDRLDESSEVEWVSQYRLFENLRGQIHRTVSAAQEDIRTAERARTEGPALLERMPQILAEAEARLQGGRQSSRAQAQLAEARSRYEEARRTRQSDTFDWLPIYLLLMMANNNATAAAQTHTSYNAPPPPPPPPPSRSSSSDYSSGGSYGYGDSGGSSFGGGGGFSDGGGGGGGSY